MTEEERELLVAVRRWARTHGWTSHWRGWINGRYDSDATITVCVDESGTAVRIWRKQPPVLGRTAMWPIRSTDYPVGSVRQGVDVLCALGILPEWLSSQWNAGVKAGVQLAGPVREQVMADVRDVLAQVAA